MCMYHGTIVFPPRRSNCLSNQWIHYIPSPQSPWFDLSRSMNELQFGKIILVLVNPLVTHSGLQTYLLIYELHFIHEACECHACGWIGLWHDPWLGVLLPYIVCVVSNMELNSLSMSLAIAAHISTSHCIFCNILFKVPLLFLFLHTVCLTWMSG